jgi:hypothetical protein
MKYVLTLLTLLLLCLFYLKLSHEINHNQPTSGADFLSLWKYRIHKYHVQDIRAHAREQQNQTSLESAHCLHKQ